MDPRNDVEIRIFGSRADYAQRDIEDGPRVVEIIRNTVLPKRTAEYLRVNAEIKRHYDATPSYIIVYLLRKDIYSAETIKVEVDSDFQVTNVVEDYAGGDDDEDSQPPGIVGGRVFDEDAYALNPDLIYADGEREYAFDFVVATPVPDIPSAKAAVEAIFKMAQAAGFNPKMLQGPEASVANYKQYLQSGLKGFVNIGHGSPSGIVLADGALNAAWFAGLSATALKPCVIYFNSCQVHNDPLKAAIVKAGARTFIGGIVNLLIGPSEEVCKCFWSRSFENVQGMKTILLTCEKEKYPNQGAHGFVGDADVFLKLNLRLAHAMWTHGNSVNVEFPDRMQSVQPVGYSVRLKGKPFTNNWFHFAIPTPVIVDTQRLVVGSVLLRLRVGPGAFVSAVHIYDGEQRIAVHNNLKLAPAGQFAMLRFDAPLHPAVKWGLGISVCVQFVDDANLPPDTRLLVEICSAGCDFMQVVTPYQARELPVSSVLAMERPVPSFAPENGLQLTEEGIPASTEKPRRVMEPFPN
ncbi:MAG: hypothetical protein JNM70_14030 [Anaerolineae bacterium]|nr:hypothetical protein [Anaerolineae bacterium]